MYCFLKFKHLCTLIVTIMWSLSVLANLSGVATKITFHSGMTYQSRLFGNMLVTESTRGSINYTVNESLIGPISPANWQKRFSVRLSQRDDGSYDIYRLLTPDGQKDGETLLEGNFVRNENEHTAVLEYKNEDDSWVRMEFSNTRTSPPETDADKENWRLKIVTTVNKGPLGYRGREVIKIEDELKWFDIVADPIFMPDFIRSD